MDVSLPEINIEGITDRKLAAQVSQLVTIIEGLLKRIDILTRENTTLKQEIARLKKQPPSPVFAIKDYSAKHKVDAAHKSWSKRKKKQTLIVDQVVEVPSADWCVCGNMTLNTIRTHERVVQDIIIKRNNILYRWVDQQCGTCGKIQRGSIPDLPKGSEFGASVRSWISVFKYDYRYTLPLLHRFLTGVGITISTGEISHIILGNSKKLSGSYTYLKVWGIKIARYLQSDATGAKRKAGKTSSTILRQHLHFVGHTFLSIFKITRRYNATIISDLLGKTGRRKPFVSDDHSSYGRLLMILYKQLCWLHEIRHYLKLDPRFIHNRKRLDEVIDQIWEWYDLAKAYCLDPTDEQKILLEQLFDRITMKRTGYQELDHRLALTGKKKERLLVFLNHPFLPIHNNQSEQDVRDAVLIRKISRETKSEAGDRSLERHLSIIHTAKKQGLDVFETVHGLLTGHLSPSVLIAKTV